MTGSPCFDAETLTRYIDGRLAGDQKDLAEKHLLECDLCLEEFVMAKTMVREIDNSEFQPGPAGVVRDCLKSIGKKLRNIAGWISDMAPPPWMYGCHASPVRSSVSPMSASSEFLFVKKDIGDLRAELFIEKAEKNCACMSVKVFTGKKTAKNVSLTLIREGNSPTARYLTRDYESFDKLRYGIYNLILERNALEEGRYLFQIDNEGFHER